MTIKEVNRFYQQDKKKYIILKNKELLTWLKEVVKNGYHPFIDTEQLQELVNNITNWYEIKYPNRELEGAQGVTYFDFQNIKSLSKYMDIQQLMYRLPTEQLNLIKCVYRASGGGLLETYDEQGERKEERPIIFMRIYRKDIATNFLIETMEFSDFLLYAFAESGQVSFNMELENYLNEEAITLDELLVLFESEYEDKLDFSSLQECIYNHNCDLELRRKILQLTALEMLYSKNTRPDIGYERAKRFIEEWNKELGLNLSPQEMDELMGKNDTNGEEFVQVKKTYLDKNGQENAYSIMEQVKQKFPLKILTKRGKK